MSAQDQNAIRPVTDWRTTDQQEVARRRERALREPMRVRNLAPEHPVFSNFEVESLGSGKTYQVELRGLKPLACSCTCVDFRINGLGTCKHVERVLRWLASDPALLERAAAEGSGRIDLVPDPETGRLMVERNLNRIPDELRDFFDVTGLLLPEFTNEEILTAFGRPDRPALRVSQDVAPWLRRQEQEAESLRLRRDYERRVQTGDYPAQETKIPLLPYQREGMLHLAFTGRALLADETGLGKTAQAIAAAALLHRLGKVNRVLVIAPASLKAEWEEQIARFTDLSYQLVFGEPEARRASYEEAAFFTLANYGQVVRDVSPMNAFLKPDCVILDEAQRIRNWDSPEAQAVKRLQSRYVFILTGAPPEDRLDGLYSIMSIIDPQALGPLFRFNREFYELDDQGRPVGRKNLERLRKRLAPFLLRRCKADVEKEMPDRTDRTVFVRMTPEQRAFYGQYEERVARLLAQRRTRALTRAEIGRLRRELALMRMVCDTPSILQPDFLDCPKLDELRETLEAALSTPDRKVLIFSEWERMLARVRTLCEEMGFDAAWHTGAVPQEKRRQEIRRFKNQPGCRIFLSTDTGSAGMNLQQAGMVINCDLPWSPAQLERRVARAWRKNQRGNVTVVNLVTEDSIESRMMEMLERERARAADAAEGGAVPGAAGGRQGFLQQLAAVMPLPPPSAASPFRAGLSPEALRATDPELGFAAMVEKRLGDRLARCESYRPPGGNPVILLVVDGDADAVGPAAERIRTDWFGKCVGMQTPSLVTVSAEAFASVKRLLASGLVSLNGGAGRILYRREEGLSRPEAAPGNGKALIQTLRRQAVLAYRRARRQISGLAFEQARGPLAETVLLLARAYALERDLEEPRELQEALSGAFAEWWGTALPILSRELLTREGSPVTASRILAPFFGG